MKTRHWALRLPLGLVKRCRSISAVVQSALVRPSSEEIAAFEFKSDERAFALTLLTQKTNLWTYRCNQRRFCGDFLVVDKSGRASRIFCIDLKLGKPLKLGGGGAGVQFKNAECAARAVAPEGLEIVKLSGSRPQVLGYFGVGVEKVL